MPVSLKEATPDHIAAYFQQCVGTNVIHLTFALLCKLVMPGDVLPMERSKDYRVDLQHYAKDHQFECIRRAIDGLGTTSQLQISPNSIQ